MVLHPEDYVDVVNALVGLRGLADELARVFAEVAGRDAPPTRGAEGMARSVERILEILRTRAV